MKLTMLGVNGPFPAPGGATSGYLLEDGETKLLLDCGSGVLSRLLLETDPASLTGIVLSHWHYDHCCDLTDLSYLLDSLGRKMTIWAPSDEDSCIRKAVSAMNAYEVKTVVPGERLTVGSLTAAVSPARHPVPAVMYRFTSADCIFCYTGDTNTVPHLEQFLQGADLALMDGLFTEAVWSEGKPHLSGVLACEAAKNAGVKQLIVTHLNPMIDRDQLLAECRRVRADVLLAECGANIRF